MKKMFLISLFMVTTTPLLADMVYDPVQDTIYSNPQTPDLNQNEYRKLLSTCIQIQINLKKLSPGRRFSKRELLSHFSPFLRNIGSSTALRLLSDLENDILYYPNGSKIGYLIS